MNEASGTAVLILVLCFACTLMGAWGGGIVRELRRRRHDTATVSTRIAGDRMRIISVIGDETMEVYLDREQCSLLGGALLKFSRMPGARDDGHDVPGRNGGT